MRRRTLVLGLLICLAGCASGTPFEPDMCVIVLGADSLVVVLDRQLLERCAIPRVETSVRR